MTPDLQMEARELSDRARLLLKNVPASGTFRPIFLFWAFPSFTPSYRWTVYRPHGRKQDKQPFATFTVWRCDIDYEKLRDPVVRLKYPKALVPTIEEDSVALTEPEVCDMEQRITGISLPLYLASPGFAGIDGTSFEFQYQQPFIGATLHWWHDQPVEWQPFTSAVMNIIDTLQKRRSTKSPAESPSL